MFNDHSSHCRPAADDGEEEKEEAGDAEGAATDVEEGPGGALSQEATDSFGLFRDEVGSTGDMRHRRPCLSPIRCGLRDVF